MNCCKECHGSALEKPKPCKTTFIRNICTPITSLSIDFIFSTPKDNFNIILELNKVYKISYIDLDRGLETAIGKLTNIFKVYSSENINYCCYTGKGEMRNDSYKVNFDCSEKNDCFILSINTNNIRNIELYDGKQHGPCIKIPNGTTTEGLSISRGKIECTNLKLGNVIIDENNIITNADILEGEITGYLLTTGGTTVGREKSGESVMVLNGTGIGKVIGGIIIGGELVSGDIVDTNITNDTITTTNDTSTTTDNTTTDNTTTDNTTTTTDNTTTTTDNTTTDNTTTTDTITITNAIVKHIVVKNSTSIGKHICGIRVPSVIKNTTIYNGIVVDGVTTNGVTIDGADGIITTGGITTGGTVTGGVVTGYIDDLPVTIEGTTTGNIITEGGITTGGIVTGGKESGNVIIGGIVTGGTTSGGETTGGETFVTYVKEGHLPRPTVGEYDFTQLGPKDVNIPPGPEFPHTELEVYTGNTDKTSNISTVKLY